MRRVISVISLVGSTLVLSSIALTASLFVSRKMEIVHRFARLWAAIHLKVSGIELSLQGMERLPEPPFIMMCNHQSALDIYSLLAGLPVSFKWLAKRELFSIPFVGWTMKRAGYVSIDRENPREALKAIEEAGQRIREGMVMVIFPEGTRSEDGKLLPFKQGVFNLALRARVPIVPVGICETNRLQPKGCAIPKQKGIVYIHVGEPVAVEGKGSAQKARIMHEVRDRIEGLTACQGT